MLNREDSVLYFPPEAFGPFKVLHQIGAGALGPVFRAYEPGTERLIAVKVFRLDLTPEQSAALVEQLQALVDAHITHPHIAAPVAAGLESGGAYLAQEYAVGDSLDVVLRERGAMSLADARPIVEAIVSAIEFAASRGVRHGSLHMRDVMVSGSSVRMTGFGLVDVLSKISARKPTRRVFAAGDDSDLSTAGAIAFEILTGKRPSREAVQDYLKTHDDELDGAIRAALTAASGAPPSSPADLEPFVPEDEPPARFSVVDEDLGLSQQTPEPVIDLMEPAEVAATSPAIERTSSERAPFSNWSAQPPRAVQAEVVEPTPTRRWPIVAVFMAFAVATALAVGFFLRAPQPASAPSREPVDRPVEETTVNVSPSPASAEPQAPATAPAPANRNMPPPESSAALPAPTPSRAASGAVAAGRGPIRGSLLVRSSPADADVFLNGRASGKTPLTVRDLDVGSYTIRIARDGYVTDTRTVQLTARRPTASATFNLREESAAKAVPSGPGSLEVRSRPTGARVFVNDRLMGSTPLAVPELPAGPATVRIEMDGYRVWETTVQIDAGGQARLAASLERN